MCDRSFDNISFQSPVRKDHGKNELPSKKDCHKNRNYRRRSPEKNSEREDKKYPKDKSHNTSRRRDRSLSDERKHSSSSSSRNHDRYRSDDRDRHRDDKHHNKGKRDQQPSKSQRTENYAETKDNLNATSAEPIVKPVAPNPTAAAMKAAAAAAAKLSSNVAAPSSNVELPSYYNPSAINVAKYTNQIQKRKLLWSNKDPQKNADTWQQQAQFSKDEDGKVASKFMRLMGIKSTAATSDEGAGSADQEDSAKKPNNFAKKQSDMLSRMEQQYEIARQATHTNRGMGLGFSRPY